MKNCSVWFHFLPSRPLFPPHSSGVGQLWWLSGGVEHWGAGVSLLSVSTGAIFMMMMIMMMMSCLCPSRPRWSAGLCCRRPTTSPMRRLCVAWRGNPPPARFVLYPFTPRPLGSAPPFKNRWMFVCLCAVFGCSCGYKRPPVRAGLLESRQLSVRWPADPGEQCDTPPQKCYYK